jgi:flavodoxin
MRALIICVSVSHGNTRRIAEAMAGELDAEVREPEQVDRARIASLDLVGFGSGIYDFQVHPRLRRFVEDLAPVAGVPAFCFATSGLGMMIERPWQQPLARLLRTKGFWAVDSFCCRGYDTSPAALLLGGISKGRPDERDMKAARAFASRVRERVAAHTHKTPRRLH